MSDALLAFWTHYNPTLPTVAINKNNHYGGRKFTLLHHAVAEQRVDLLPELLQIPMINVNKRDTNGNTALIRAIRLQNLEMIDMLLRHPNIDVNRKTIAYKGGDVGGSFCPAESPITVALRANRIDIVQKLLDTGKVRIADSGMLDCKASLKRYPAIRSLLEGDIPVWNGPIPVLDKYIQIQQFVYMALWKSDTNPHAAAIMNILTKGRSEIYNDAANADDANDDRRIFSYIQAFKHLSDMCFAERSVDFTTKRLGGPEHHALLQKDEEFVKMEALFEEVAQIPNPNTPFYFYGAEAFLTPFTYCILLSGNFPYMKEKVLDLLRYDSIDVNACTDAVEWNGWSDYHFTIQHKKSPLMVAIESSTEDVIAALLERKDLNINHKTPDQSETALMVAVRLSSIPILKRLLQHPLIQVNEMNIWNRTACSYAAEYGHLEALQILLDHPATARWNIRYALKRAAECNKPEIISYCLERGAREDTRVPFRRAKHMAYLLAAKHGHTDCLKLLLASRINPNYMRAYGWSEGRCVHPLFQRTPMRFRDPELNHKTALDLYLKNRILKRGTIETLMKAGVHVKYDSLLHIVQEFDRLISRIKDSKENWKKMKRSTELTTYKEQIAETFLKEHMKFMSLLEILLKDDSLCIYEEGSEWINLFSSASPTLQKTLRYLITVRKETYRHELARILVFGKTKREAPLPFLPYDVVRVIDNFLLPPKSAIEKREDWYKDYGDSDSESDSDIEAEEFRVPQTRKTHYKDNKNRVYIEIDEEFTQIGYWNPTDKKIVAFRSELALSPTPPSSPVPEEWGGRRKRVVAGRNPPPLDSDDEDVQPIPIPRRRTVVATN
jgi:ankyrin repeat protein